MAENSKIEWCHHTFNLGWGCFKKSPGCANCYAKRDANRYGWDVWGKDKPRRLMSLNYYMKPHAWNKKAKRAGERHRVFCGSMMDWTDECWYPMLPFLWQLWRITPDLDWLMLTKNAEKIKKSLPPFVSFSTDYSNVWMGVSVENQRMANLRIPQLLHNPSKIRFISCEPLLEPVDLGLLNGIDWVIVGGESGSKTRPMDPDWARSIRDQCSSAGIPFFMKQMDKVQPIPEDLMIREFPK